jgi:hypothetical protein
LTKDLGKTEEEEEDLESTQVARGRLARFEMVAIFFVEGNTKVFFLGLIDRRIKTKKGAFRKLFVIKIIVESFIFKQICIPTSRYFFLVNLNLIRFFHLGKRG